MADLAIKLYWNDADTILRGGHWWVEQGETGRRTTLHEIAGRSGEDFAERCVLAHVGFLGSLLEAADALHRTLTDGLADEAGTPGSVEPGSPLGRTCTDLAAALDAWVYDLSRATRRREAELGPRATELVLDAVQVSVYLRSLVGAHRWPTPEAAG